MVSLCLSLAFCLTHIIWRTNWHDKVGKSMVVHENVLTNESFAPYQYNNFIPAKMCQFAHDHFGIEVANAYAVWCGLGYLMLFFCSWYWFARVTSPNGVILAMFALAAYAFYMLPHVDNNPTDMIGAGLFALALAFLSRDRMWPLCLVATAAGFLWTKGFFLVPIVFLFYLSAGQWRKGLLWGFLIGICSGIGSVVYLATLGYHPIYPPGVLTTSVLIAVIPVSMLFHFALAAPPFISYLRFRDRLPQVLKVAIVVYPLMWIVYLTGHLWIFEMRAWWNCVPVFAALLAQWCPPEKTRNATLT